jgi:hypothetical protein
MQEKNAAESAIRKLDKFFAELQPEEQKVVGLIVSSTLQRAARAQAERDWLKESEILLELIAPELAPNIVAKLGSVVAGQLAPQQLGSIRAEKRPSK